MHSVYFEIHVSDFIADMDCMHDVESVACQAKRTSRRINLRPTIHRYEMICGEPPFVGKTPAGMIMKIITGSGCFMEAVFRAGLSID